MKTCSSASVVARARAARIDADDADAVLLGALEILERARAERAVARAPAPHDDEPRVDVVDRLAARALVLGLGAERLLAPRRPRPRPRGSTRAPCSRRTCGATAGRRRGCAASRGCRCASSRGWRPGRTCRARGASGAATSSSASSQPIRSNCPAPRGPVRRSGWRSRSGWFTRSTWPKPRTHACSGGISGVHLRGVGADLDDLPVAHVRVDDAAAAAVVAARAGDDRLAGLGATRGAS